MKLGRRIPLMILGAIFNVGAILQVAASGQLGLIYAGRALTGNSHYSRRSLWTLLTM